MNSATILLFWVTGPQQHRRRGVQPGTGRADGLHDLRALQRAVRTRDFAAQGSTSCWARRGNS
eukprot:6577446-Prymnesium_polylepis.1